MYEQINIFDLLLPKFQIEKPIRLIELFAGIGSQAMALRDIGADFEHYRVVEFDRFAVASYNAIHGTNFPTTDITKIHGEDLGIEKTDDYCYIMTYSFPCQDLSVAGKGKGMKKGSGTRSGLLWEVERLLGELNSLPQILLMENVPQVHSEENMPDFRRWIDFLESKNYSNYWQDLNAKDYGIAQNRNRCFMVSILGEYNYRFPVQEKTNKNISQYLEKDISSNYYLNNAKSEKLIKDLRENGYQNTPSSESGIIVAGSLNPQKECQDRVRVLSVNGVCQGLRSTDYKDPPKILETNYRIRKLTPLECWRIMDFTDDDFRKAEKVSSNSQLYKQAGNSIVKSVLMGIFKNMLPQYAN